MYSVGHYSFYDASDPESVIIEAYASTALSSANKKHGKIADEATTNQLLRGLTNQARLKTLNDTKELYASLVHDDQTKAAFVRTLNVRIIDEIIPIYEQHWIEFLGDGGYRTDPQLIRMDASIASALDIHNKYPKEYKAMLMGLHKTSYLSFNINTGYSKDSFITININQYIINKLIDHFEGSYIKDGRVFIKYSPAADIGNAILLTRLLHTYL